MGVLSEQVVPRRVFAAAGWAWRAMAVGLGVVVVGANASGLPYYFAGAQERLRHPLRLTFRPSGTLGQALGLLALALFLFLWLYPLRKQIRWPGLGALHRWLDFHVVAGVAVPFVAATHASWRFTGLIGLGYLSMAIVALSGVIGRYLYVRIPRSRDGLEYSRDEAAAERRQLLGDISLATGLAPTDIEKALAPAPAGGGGLAAIVGRMLRDDLERRRATRALLRHLTLNGGVDPGTLRRVGRLARREMALAQQARMLDAIHRVFRFWHVAHRPLAIMALLAVIVHVAVAIAVGQTWFW